MIAPRDLPVRNYAFYAVQKVHFVLGVYRIVVLDHSAKYE